MISGLVDDLIALITNLVRLVLQVLVGVIPASFCAVVIAALIAMYFMIFVR